MSNYSSFLVDFPKRCIGLLKRYENDAKLRDREITLLLTIASAGFTIPFERLRPQNIEGSQHPSADRQHFKEATECFDKLMETCFVDSPLWKQANHSWSYIKKMKSVKGPPDEWKELTNAKPLSHQKTTGSVLKHLRNSIAHGNVFTSGHSRISTLFLLSRNSEPGNSFALIKVSVQDFRIFLLNWFKYLETLDIPANVNQLSVLDWPLPAA